MKVSRFKLDKLGSRQIWKGGKGGGVTVGDKRGVGYKIMKKLIHKNINIRFIFIKKAGKNVDSKV